MSRQIQLRNVRVNNLKNVDLDIPHGQWVAFCGLSGSGKSSLAFDTLYAEGQRRYIESLSPHTRQFIDQLDKPDADQIDGIPPAIAVKAFRGKIGKKTTVGTSTEITEYLRLMFARIAVVYCSDCNVQVSRHSPQSVAQSLCELPDGIRYQIVFRSNPDEDFGSSLLAAKRNGFARAIVGDSMVDLSNPNPIQVSNSTTPSNVVRIVVDRLKSGSSDVDRIRESLELAFQFGFGQCEVLYESGLEDPTREIAVGGKKWFQKTYSRELGCVQCQRAFPTPEPRLFSFGNRFGACSSCEGLGYADNGCTKLCDVCNGSRLNRDALCFRVGGKNLSEIGSLKIETAIDFFNAIKLDESELAITRQIMPQVRSRLKLLNQVGLAYLSLDRSLWTLSAGEAQRVSLTACLSSTLVNMMYVLDEPSIGLHSHDIEKLSNAIGDLHSRGNTVVVVDHDTHLIEAAQRVVEVGPGAGAAGGQVVFDGTFGELLESETSITGEFLAGRRGFLSGVGNRRPPRGRLKIVGATGNNLKNIDVEFPLGCLCIVTGVSGAGKSSLVQQTLYGAICNRKDIRGVTPLPYQDLFGESQIDEVVLIDQSPIGRSPRSNPVTYVKAFDDIRRTFAETLDAKTHNIKVSQFSFNVAGGRCDKCEGAGRLSVDMQFLPDVFIVCDQCRGTRYRDEILAVKYRGKSIAEVLDLTVREAFSFFRGQPKVQAKLKSLIDVGLDYIRLGQPATTLSSGEAQRLKLGHYLNASKSKRALFILDEPSTGLHMRDVMRLVECFDALLSVGHSMIVVEHNLQLIKNADWVVDLGPGAADEGGTIVVQGRPEDLTECELSLTGQYLKQELERDGAL